MYRVSGLFYDSVETVVVISSVVHSTDGTIGFGNGVVTLYNISIALFVLGLVVSGMGILNSIAECIFGVGLEEKSFSAYKKFKMEI